MVRFTTGPESPLRGVTRDAWRTFYVGLEMQAPGEISESGGLGMFDIRPRRLVELGYATGLRSERRPVQHKWIGERCTRCKLTRSEDVEQETCPNGRQIQVCEFILPWTQTRFLGNPYAQYTAFAQSMRLYYDALREGNLAKPKDVSVAGALVMLHRGGRGALEAWPQIFAGTKTLFDKVQKAF
jgi:hypothetical protein